jgi:hypothetical protein
MRRWIAVGVVVLSGAAVLAQEAELEATIVTEFRLALVDGSTHRVRGPIERRNGTIVFRDRQGLLGSIRDSQVQEIVPLGSGSSDEAAPLAPPELGDAAIRYTNSDLAPLPEPTPLPEAPSASAPPAEAAPPETAAPETPPAPAEPPSILSPFPREVAGRPESWWREQIAGLRRDIREFETEEGTTRRLWECAMRDIPLDQCRPEVDRLPPVNRLRMTPNQRSLNEKLRQIRVDLDRRRDELRGFIDRAIDSGVPTAWLLAVPDEPAEESDQSETTESHVTGEPGEGPEVE